MNDKAFLPVVLDAPDPETDDTYAQVAFIVACYAARHGGVDLALELGDALGIPERSWAAARLGQECQWCGDTYHDLAGHYSQDFKGCGTQERAAGGSGG